MNISRLVLENILSHRTTEIQFDTGLNVVVGESGYGKSAIVRGLNWLILGEEHAAGLLASGQSRCRVTVYTDDGVSLTREWEEGEERYVIALPGGPPRFVPCPDGSMPPEAMACHGIVPSRIGTHLKLCLQLPAPQEPPFLINQLAKVKATALGSLQGVLAADAALMNLRTDDPADDRSVTSKSCSPAFRDQVQDLIRDSVQSVRFRAKEELECFVTTALRYTFESDLDFVVLYDPESELAGAEFFIRSQGKGDRLLFAPVAAYGSGISEFTALALRMAFMVSAYPPLPGPLVLDDPVRSLSDQYVPNVGRFLKSIADSFDLQIILLTYEQHLTGSADSVTVLSFIDGVTNAQHRGSSIRTRSHKSPVPFNDK
ncbi:MAG: AAA family ATPase [Eubacteriales bacterium]|nr:ATP-binding protein [Bacillota bacterium]MBV1727593.1 ATP-binding protein [Desulforudis sp.]MDQ7789724.1 AAA family ATPase [Clostridia bacterium]MDZ4043360.1 AAA family ATPase [Eubacteriales bacterium]MBU4532838.1 ATP-binding protein [Bacillota bacterium]